MVAPVMAAMVAAPIITGLIGAHQASKGRDEARALLQQAMAEFSKIGMPPDLSKRIILEQFQNVGQYTPELEEDINLAESQVSLIQEDPELRGAQMEALGMIQQRAKVGIAPEERAALNQLRQETQRDVEGKRQQILQNLAARGQGGSGAELIASLQAGQSGAERASQESDRMAAMASQNALEAMSRAGELGGQIRSQDFGVAQTKAGAADEFSLKNWGATNARQTRNIGALNQAQMQNLANQQRIAEMNTQQENIERQRIEEAKRDYWGDKYKLAAAKSGMYTPMAEMSAGEGQTKAQQWAGIGSALGQGFGAYQQSKDAEANRELTRDVYGV